MNVLIGGTGFIGTALAERLAQSGEGVTSIARSIPEKKTGGIVYHAADIFTHPEQLALILGRGATVFLLIGQNSSTFDVARELEGFEKVLNVVQASSPKKVLFASTVLVYGECSEPVRESHSLSPKDRYAQFKVSCEKMIQERLVGIPVAILRLANVYGSERNKGFIGLVLKKISEGTEIQVNGDGLQERDYIFLDEVASAILMVKDNLKESEIVNIATGKSETLLNVIDLVCEEVGDKALYTVTGIPVDEVEKSRISNAKLREKYGFVPQVFLREGIQKTWERYNKEV